MPSRVKRSYDNEARQASSEQTRTRILVAAREAITAHGYRAATIANIARTADVHVDTIYALIGRKPELLTALIERSISGTDRALAPAQRGYVQKMRAESDPARKLAIYAGAMCEIHQRMAPLFHALRDAAATDDEAQRVWRRISDRRARNMRDLVRELGPNGTLRAGLSHDEAADIIWATASTELFILLTRERDWSPDTYQRWLADTWSRLLLDSNRTHTSRARS